MKTSMRRATLLLLMLAASYFAIPLFEPGLRCLYYCAPESNGDAVWRAVSVPIVLLVAAAWGAFCARLAQAHAVYLPVLSVLLAFAAMLSMLATSTRAFAALGGAAAVGFAYARSTSDQLQR